MPDSTWASGTSKMCVDRPIIIEKYANRRRYNTGTYTL